MRLPKNLQTRLQKGAQEKRNCFARLSTQISSRPSDCPKICKLDCKREHKKSTTVLLAWSKPNHKLQNPAQEKAKHKSSTTVLQSEAQTQPQTPKTSTRKAQLFCDLEHKEKHKLHAKVKFTSEPTIAF